MIYIKEVFKKKCYEQSKQGQILGHRGMFLKMYDYNFPRNIYNLLKGNVLPLIDELGRIILIQIHLIAKF